MSVIKGVLLRFSRLVSCCSDSCEYVNRMNHDSVSMSESSSLFSRVLLIISGRLIRLTKFQIPYPRLYKKQITSVDSYMPVKMCLREVFVSRQVLPPCNA